MSNGKLQENYSRQKRQADLGYKLFRKAGLGTLLGIVLETKLVLAEGTKNVEQVMGERSHNYYL